MASDSTRIQWHEGTPPRVILIQPTPADRLLQRLRTNLAHPFGLRVLGSLRESSSLQSEDLQKGIEIREGRLGQVADQTGWHR